MEQELCKEKLNSLFLELCELIEKVDSPAIQASLRTMLVYCHMSRWQVGATDFTDSELEIACWKQKNTQQGVV